jgi:subtilisin family serine protease
MIDVVWLLNRLYPTVNPPAATNRIKVGILDTGLNKEPGTVSATAVINYDVPGNKKDDDKNGYVDDAFGWNALTNGSTRDFNGHGTAVAKVIHTIAPKAELFPVTVLNQQGVGDCKTVSQGINYAVRQGADIINISASGKGICTLLKDVVAYAQANGVIVIMAAGNDSTNVVNLQSRTDALVVGAAESGKRVKYTNAANIYAPDRDVKSQKRGTSYSAAYVSGGAALVLTKSNNLTVDQLQNQLVNTAKLYTSGVKMIDLQEATK